LDANNTSRDRRHLEVSRNPTGTVACHRQLVAGDQRIPTTPMTSPNQGGTDSTPADRPNASLQRARYNLPALIKTLTNTPPLKSGSSQLFAMAPNWADPALGTDSVVATAWSRSRGWAHVQQVGYRPLIG
jgi:hypothetical protein